MGEITRIRSFLLAQPVACFVRSSDSFASSSTNAYARTVGANVDK